VAQGVGNVVAGMIGGIPVTSVVVRGSVNINAGARSKISTIFHGALLLAAVAILPTYINLIPLSCLAAILIVTGVKLVNPAQFQRMFLEGRYQFVPFAVTLAAIVVTDLLKGIAIGMAVSAAFILNSNFRRPLRRIVEQHLDGEVLHIELANQVSFLNRAALEKILRERPRGSRVLLDAQHTDYIDPDVLDLIRDFKEEIAPAHDVQVSLRGFREKYQLEDEIQFADFSTRELQEKITAAQAWRILEQGNERFRTGRCLTRDLGRQVGGTSKSQHPLAVVLSCIDSRSPAEIILDLGLGDVFSVRVAGNVVSGEVLASMEYGCAVAGAKLILVLGHTRCGAVGATVDFFCHSRDPVQASGCQHIDSIAREIAPSIDLEQCRQLAQAPADEKAAFSDAVARRNVLRAVDEIVARSETIRHMVADGRVAVLGAMYDISTGEMKLLTRAPGE
jgi:carbonic anhydrase/SulP family sulfate permease